MQRLVLLLLGVGVGLGLGWLLFGPSTAGVAPVARPEPVAAPRQVEPVAAHAPAAAPAVPAAPAPAPLPTATASPAPAHTAVSPEEVAQLRLRVAELEARTAESKPATANEPLPFPKDLDPKFTQEHLRQAFTGALKEAGFPADVTAVDCTEFPCIVFGTGFGAAGDVKALKGTSSFSTYDHARLGAWGFNTKDEDPARRFFGVSVAPESTAWTDELRQRVQARVDAMWAASRPAKKKK